MKTYTIMKLVSVMVFVGVASTQTLRPDIESHPNWNLLDRGGDCGYSVPHFRIIGGTEASLGQYPWLARLGYTRGNEPKKSKEATIYDCGGTIINDKYILTAAHCGPDTMRLNLVSVTVGEHDERTDPDCRNDICAPPVQSIEVESVSCHEEFNHTSIHNDICLVRLWRPIVFNEYVQPICLPAYDMFLFNDFNGEIMEVAGWGVTHSRRYKKSKTLQTLKVPVVPRDQCLPKNFIQKVELIEKQMCAGGKIGEGSCAGDSGGPLMKPFSIQASPRYFQVGVVSFGHFKCAETDHPGVYTKVADYMNWILDHVRP